MGDESHEGNEKGHEAQGHEGCRGGCTCDEGHEGNEGDESYEGNEEGHEAQGNEGCRGGCTSDEGHEGNEGNESYEGNERDEEVSGWKYMSALLLGDGCERCLAPSRGGVPRLTLLYNHL